MDFVANYPTRRSAASKATRKRMRRTADTSHSRLILSRALGLQMGRTTARIRPLSIHIHILFTLRRTQRRSFGARGHYLTWTSVRTVIDSSSCSLDWPTWRRARRYLRDGRSSLRGRPRCFPAEVYFNLFPRSKSRKPGDLEQQVVTQVDSLRDDTNNALQSSRDLVRSYGTFARMMDGKFRSLAQRGGQVFPDPDITRKFEEISGHSSELMRHASQMQEKLLDLVMMLDNTKQDSKKALWKKIGSWLLQTFKVLAKILDFGSTIAGYIPHVGSIASSVMQAGSNICASAAKICQEMNDGES